MGDPLVAGIAALLFGVHPAHVEAVAWISAATESLFAIFAFGTILCHIRWRDTSESRWRMASLGLFAAAIFSKETAIILPVLIYIYDRLFPRIPSTPPRPGLWNALRAALPYAVVFLVYLPLRIHALGRLAPRTEPWPPATVVATIPSVLFFYLRQLVLPIQYSTFYPLSPVRDPGPANFYLPLLAVAVAAGALIWIWGRSRIIAFSIALLVVPILPVLNLPAFLSNDFLHDRYLYLGLGGFSLLVALAVQHLGRNRESVRIGIGVALAAVLAAVTVHTSLYWRDDPTLFTRAIQVAPENHLAQVYLGEALVRDKRYIDALPVLKSALVGFPLGYSVYNSIARCYIELADYDQAAVYLQDAITIGPRYPGAYLNLGMVELQQGQLRQAEAHARQALRLRQHADASPAYNHYHFGLGMVLERKGDLEGAMAEYQTELRENPADDEVRARMLELQARLRSLRQ